MNVSDVKTYPELCMKQMYVGEPVHDEYHVWLVQSRTCIAEKYFDIKFCEQFLHANKISLQFDILLDAHQKPNPDRK